MLLLNGLYIIYLRLNHDKTKAMIFSTRHRALRLDKPTPFKLLGNEMKFVNAHIYLGITLDVAMTLNRLLKSVNKQVTNKIFTLLKIRKFITKDAAILIYKQTILPLIDYAGCMLIACNKDHKESLQKLQNEILRICCGYRLSDKISTERIHGECKIIA